MEKTQKGVACGYVWNKNDPFTDEHIRSLKADDKAFRILCLTDIHLKNRGTFAARLGVNYLLDGAGYIGLSRLIKKVRPDLITVLGDTVCTPKNDVQLEKFSGFMDKFCIPWAPVFGNHDEEGRADKAKLCDIFLKSGYCVFDYGPKDLHEAGNYAVTINRNGKPKYTLYFLDSGATVDSDGNKHADGIIQNQIDWYNWVGDGIKKTNNSRIPSMAFFHIPLKQYEGLTEFEIGEDAEKAHIRNSDFGFFNTFKQSGGTHIFAGHYHNSNFVSSFKGVKLCYVQKSSYNCYFKFQMTGGTLITIQNDNTVNLELVNF